MMLHRMALIIALPAVLTSAVPDKVVSGRDLPPINTPQPLHGAGIPNCEQFHLVTTDETCASIASSLGMSIKDIGRLNPYVGPRCERDIMAGYWLCVKALPELNEETDVPNNQGVDMPALKTKLREAVGVTRAPPKTKAPVPKTTTVTVDKPEPTREQYVIPKECYLKARNCPTLPY